MLFIIYKIKILILATAITCFFIGYFVLYFLRYLALDIKFNRHIKLTVVYKNLALILCINIQMFMI